MRRIEAASEIQRRRPQEQQRQDNLPEAHQRDQQAVARVTLVDFVLAARAVDEHAADRQVGCCEANEHVRGSEGAISPIVDE